MSITLSDRPRNTTTEGSGHTVTTRRPQGARFARHGYFWPLTSKPIYREQQYCDSILDSLSRLRRKRPDGDDFEDFLRSVHEITLADIYRAFRNESAQSFADSFWVASLRTSGIQSAFPSSAPEGGEVTVAHFFERAGVCLREASTGATTVCCLTRTSSQIKQLFSYWRLFALSAQMESHFWLRALLSQLLLMTRHIDESTSHQLLNLAETEAGSQEPWQMHQLRKPLPTAPCWDFRYMWPGQPMSFDSVAFHTKRPYSCGIPTESVRLSNHAKPESPYNLTLVFETLQGLSLFRRFLVERSGVGTTMSASDPKGDGAAETGVYQVVFTIHAHMTAACHELATQITSLATEMTYRCRAHPGRSEYLYLVYLGDHIQVAINGLTAAEDQLQRCCALFPIHPTLQTEEKSLHADTKETLVALEACQRFLIKSRGEVKTFEELKQAQIAGVMQFLVAVYVPLAFVSSYLGMNTVEILNDSVHSSTFWIASVPLVVITLLLPLSFTIIARVARGAGIAAAAFSLRKWPMLADLSIVAFVFSVIIAHIVNWRVAGDPYFVAFFDRISPHEAVVVNGVLALLAALKALEQTVLKNRRGRMWFFTWMAVVSIALVCLGLSFLDQTCATLVTPLVFMIFVLAIRPLLF